ncbi:MAG: hypothetical protein QY326_07585 [Bdellovibrionota bacterium]|nr:MAG: hypothetical protein QY326_07585 [Bdellovibrionota bacterium]
MKRKSLGLPLACILLASLGTAQHGQAQAINLPANQDFGLTEMACDRTVFGTRTFPALQHALNSVRDINHDGEQVVCVRGIISNDESAGDVPSTLQVENTSHIILRGISIDGEAPLIRKVTTSPVGLDSVLTANNSTLWLENIRFEHSTVSPSTTAISINLIRGNVESSNVSISLQSTAPYSTALQFRRLQGGYARFQNLAVDLMQSPLATAIVGYGYITAINGLGVQGDGDDQLLVMHGYGGAGIDQLSNIQAVGLGTGLRFDVSEMTINELSHSSIEAVRGSALHLENGARIRTIDDVELTGCEMTVDHWTSLEAVNALRVRLGGNC